MPTELQTERRGRCLILTLSSSDGRHALSAQVLAAGIETLGSAESDADVDAVVLHGAGLHFSAGGVPALPPLLPSFIDALKAFPKPVLAAVEGEAGDAGCVLALCCDLLVAAGDARFVVTAPGTAGLLTGLLPGAALRRARWLAEPFSAQQLQHHGLVAELVAHGDALAAALQLAGRVGALPATLVAQSKELCGR